MDRVNIKIETDTTHEQFESAVNKLVNYVLKFDEEYHRTNEHSEFEKGQLLAYYTILDTVKNQLDTDCVVLNCNLGKICDDLMFGKR